MQFLKSFSSVVFAAAALAGCSTVHQPVGSSASYAGDPHRMPYHWSAGLAPKAHQDGAAIFGMLTLRPGEYRWVADMPQSGEPRVVIDPMAQLFYVYRGQRLVGVSTISSGKPGHETPFGYWKVFLKKRNGYSRKYDNAPMPFMQMYDEKGIAFHAGRVPGYPASHGCVRLPLKFAEQLFGVTDVGTKVVVEG
jgi:hypothetical protein